MEHYWGAMVFYNKLKGVLVNMGFKMNEYNECTFNKMINDYQCTIQMHVDDQLNDVFGSKGEYFGSVIRKHSRVLGNDH